ncbi:pyrroline-5-carboxylate reductase [Amphibacillus marinus]|uniref:Pyrroline-5-carboxylate reductase n=1 Tax=Amphibacillus marinus TaxID=872970 RepID=A0A1H8PDB2_9BACI|nr:pyrroline-5-carboxylate reductase [Amphibacillus marinus]SEO39932.1 pyrroline-5-carboxylate reductase [Amphibacillus marinus]
MNKMTFIGAGSMAEALIAGMVARNFSPSVITVTNRTNKQRLIELKEKYGIQVEQDSQQALQQATIIVLAIKPKDAQTVLEQIKPFLNKEILILSVMAGISTQYIEQILELDIAVVRAMPNTSAMIGLSATAIAKGQFANQDHVEMATQLFVTVGVVELLKEQEIDIATAIAGSGPAYFYYIVEAMETKAKELGLAEGSAKRLINQTLLGAAAMLTKSSDSPAELRKKITSPKGTTEAGIHALAAAEVDQAIKEAIQAAYQRSVALGHTK